jgi:hypothetical protein
MFKRLKLFLAWRKWKKSLVKPYNPNGNYATYFYKAVALNVFAVVCLFVMLIGMVFYKIFKRLRGKNETIGKT